MVPITKWLLIAESTTAPSVHLIMGFRVGYFYWAHLGTDRLHFLLFDIHIKVFLNISEIFDVQVLQIALLEGLDRILWLLYPRLCSHVLHLPHEVPMGLHQSSHLL
jgi:hypothetical protein